ERPADYGKRLRPRGSATSAAAWRCRRRERGRRRELMFSYSWLVNLPPYAVILTMIARSSPERPVRAVDHDGVDRAGGPLLECRGVPHPPQLGAHPWRRRVVEQNPPRADLVHAEGAAHLERIEVRRLGRFLHGHPELDDV